MPAILNIFANLLLGAGLAYAVREFPGFRKEFFNGPFLLLAAFQAVIITPITTFLFRFYPQWSLLYGFDPQIFTHFDKWVGVFSFMAVVCNIAAGLLGYTLMRRGVLENDKRWQLGPVVASGTAILCLLIMYGERIVYMGDYDAYWQGNAVFIFKHVAGWIGLALYVGAGTFVKWVVKSHQ